MNKQAFITQVGAAAVIDMIETNVLASITVAQAALESAWGTAAPGCNLFGIKGSGTTQTTQEFINGQWITVQAGFRCYPDWCGSIRDHSLFLTVNARYRRAGFFDRCIARDYVGAARALQTAGYATDPSYAAQLIAIIDSNDLTRFDEEADDMIDELKAELAAVKQRLEAVEKRLIDGPMPDWFATEFGQDALNGIIDTPSGDYDFWRNLAVELRLKRR